MYSNLIFRDANLYIKVFFSLIVILLSTQILPYYQLDDQNSYRFFYFCTSAVGLGELFFLSEHIVSTNEPVYVFLSWLFRNLSVSKDIYISLFNGLFAYVMISIMQLRSFNTHIIIITITVFLNFYILVLFFAAERLKFAALFGLLYILYSNSKYRYIYLGLSIFSHVQILILYFSYIFKELLLGSKAIDLRILLAIFVLTFLTLGEHIYQKALCYISINNDIEVLYKSFVFFILALYYSYNRKETIAIYVPLLMSIYFLGGDRLNMFAYFIFLYYGLKVNRGVNLGIIFTSLYFSYKSIILLTNIIMHGNAFYK